MDLTTKPPPPPHAARPLRRRQPTTYRPLVSVLAAAAVGIAAGRWLPPSLPDPGTILAWPLICLLVAAVLLVAWRRADQTQRPRAATTLLLLSVAAAFAAYAHIGWNLYDEHEIGRFARIVPQPVNVEAIARAAPREIPWQPTGPLEPISHGVRTRLALELRAIRDGNQWLPASGNTTLWLDGQLLGIRAGDRLRIFGELAAIPPARNPGQFDVAAFRRAEGELCALYVTHPDCVERLQSGSPYTVQRFTDRLRTAGDRWLWQNLDRDRSDLASAMLLGIREQLGDQRREEFIATGTAHLFAVSGLHVGMLAAAIFFLTRLLFLPQRPALLIATIACIVYALVTDARPPVIRATILVATTCLAIGMRRRRVGANVLAAAALIILLWNPAELFRTGTQLSFLAAETILAIARYTVYREPSDPLDRLIAQTRPWPLRIARQLRHAAWQTVLISAAIWFVALPLIAARFHVVAPIGLLVNPLVILPMTVAMFSGLTCITVGWLIPPLAAPLAGVCDLCLASIDVLVEWGNQIPGGHLWVSGPSDAWLFVWYALLFAAVAVRRRFPKAAVRLIPVLAVWCMVGVAVSFASPRVPKLRVTCLAIGHGSSAVVELPDGKTLLFDAGRLGPPDATAATVASYLWSRGITQLDAVVLSHADVDHYNALPELAERITIGEVFVSPQMFREPTAALDALAAALQSRDIPIRQVWRGDRLAVGESCALRFMHPTQPADEAMDEGDDGVSDNARSLVLSVEYAGRRVLLPADLESPGLEQVTAQPPVDCDVVVAPHHGSRRSDPPGFARWSTPEWVIVSGGANTDRATLESSYGAGGAEILHTYYDGAITIEIDDDGALRVEPFLDPLPRGFEDTPWRRDAH